MQAERALSEAVVRSEAVVTSAEVFQEILHRHARSGRADAIEATFAALRAVVDTVYPIELADVERARRLLATTPTLSARDALHVAVMQARDIGRIMSFDSAFDGIPGIERVV
jgi:predicted nucleic acid-binding protein